MPYGDLIVAAGRERGQEKFAYTAGPFELQNAVHRAIEARK